MSHEMVSGIDFQLGLEMGWHHLTEVKGSISGFPDYAEYNREPIAFDNKPSGFDFITSKDKEGKRLLVAKPIADSFQFLQNTQVFDLVTSALDRAGIKYKVASLGTFGARSKRYISIELAEFNKATIGGREFRLYLSILDALDGSLSLQVRANSICIVCANTYGYSLKDKGEFSMGVKHTSNHEAKCENMGKIVEAFAHNKRLFERFLASMHETPCSKETAKEVFAGFLGKGQEISPRAVKTVDRMGELFLRGRGNKGETFLDAFSSVTDYYSHESSTGRGMSQQVESSEIGTGRERKEAFGALFTGRLPNGETYFNRKAIETVATMGRASLALANN